MRAGRVSSDPGVRVAPPTPAGAALSSRGTARPRSSHRPTPARRLPYRAELDGLRALAAIGVVAFHVEAESSTSDLTYVLTGLAMGPFFVTFFAISGFVLYRGWAQRHLDPAPTDQVAAPRSAVGGADGRIARYLWRRALRIYPLYWVVVTVAMLVSRDEQPLELAGVVQVYLLLPFPDPQAIFGLGLRLVVWTLIADVVFYLYVVVHGLALTALVRRLRHRWSAFVVETTVLAALAGVALVASLFRPGPVALVTCATGGMWFAVLEAEERATGRRRAAVRTVVAAWPVWAVLFALLTPPLVAAAVHTVSRGGQMSSEPGFHVLLSIAGLALLANLLGGPEHGPLARAFRSRALRRLGSLSYGIYLWHPVVLVLLARQLPRGAFILRLVVAVACSTVLAAATHAVVERPLARRRRRVRVPG